MRKDVIIVNGLDEETWDETVQREPPMFPRTGAKGKRFRLPKDQKTKGFGII